MDAAQAVGREPIAFDALGIDLLSLSGHKLGGPAGTGALLVRRGLRLAPLLTGGEQERARRAGLEPVAALAGLGAACAALTALDEQGRPTFEVEADTARRQRDRIVTLAGSLTGVTVHGERSHQLPHLVSLGIDGVEPQGVLLGLDRAGIAAHSGSACSSESLEPSPVLAAMGIDAHHSLRLSVGWSTTDADLDQLDTALGVTIDRLRSLALGA